LALILEHNNDLAEFDIRARWEQRPPKDFPSPDAVAWGFDQYGLWQEFSAKGVAFKMRYIPSGTFLMGSPEDEPKRLKDELQHQVVLTQGFWLGETTVTQALWEAVTGTNPSYFNAEKVGSATKAYPVETVSWDDCKEFLDTLNLGFNEPSFHLPTEAQWEYACRAGTLTPFSTGLDLTTEQANYNGNYPYASGKKGIFRETTVSAKSFNPNAWGLYQMHGNVYEWCLDNLRGYNAEPTQDPLGQLDGPKAVVRGGSWYDLARYCRSAHRDALSRDYRLDGIGLRLARVSPPSQQENQESSKSDGEPI